MGKKPSFDTVLALARAFDESKIYLLNLSGLLDEKPKNPLVDRASEIIQILPDDKKQMVIDFVKVLLQSEQAKML